MTITGSHVAPPMIVCVVSIVTLMENAHGMIVKAAIYANLVLIPVNVVFNNLVLAPMKRRERQVGASPPVQRMVPVPVTVCVEKLRRSGVDLISVCLLKEDQAVPIVITTGIVQFLVEMMYLAVKANDVKRAFVRIFLRTKYRYKMTMASKPSQNAVVMLQTKGNQHHTKPC